MTNGEIIEQLENTIGLIKQDGKDWLDDRDIPILEACIKALTALDEIRAEIEQNAYPIVHGVNNHERGMTLYGILQIIDKYKAESED